MCGIFGVLRKNGGNIDKSRLRSAVRIISHRGPDDEGYAVFNTSAGSYEDRYDDNSQIRKGSHILSGEGGSFDLAFGFRRLSILDLSSNGHQPFTNDHRSVCLIFNGEIYNYIEIREELVQKGYRFRTGTDTEVILNSYLEWGTECLQRFNGMWAIALYDVKKDLLFCSRDRFGVKPFYYFDGKDEFVFASELKSITEYFREDEGFSKILNEDIAYDYLVNNFVDHTTETFIKGIRHLPPSHFIKAEAGKLNVERYFSLDINRQLGDYEADRSSALSSAYGDLLMDAVKIRLRSDVPVGTCLSGGLDSSTITYFIGRMLSGEGVPMQQIGDRQKTFSAVYDDVMYDERRFIEQIVRESNCSSHYVFPDEADFPAEAEDFIFQLDEPVAGTSPYAQWNVMRLARQNGVTVLLDGQGADESLGGYEVYFGFLYSNLFRSGNYATLLSEVLKNFRKGVEISTRGLKYYLTQKGGNVRSSTSQYYSPEFLDSHKDRSVLSFRTTDNLNVKLFEDLTSYILPSLLRYEDRNAMRFSIESRTPFLDYRLVKMLFETEGIYKIHNGWSKWILRNSMNGRLPDGITWRRDKKGFPTPERKWMMKLRNDFKDTIESDRSGVSELLNSKDIVSNYDKIISDPAIKSHFLWKIYNLLKWCRLYGVRL
ncbi:MAG: asparagine synthase (glutamine-hydrolyzing) [Ignavibacteria bacterium]|nr:asparagine synthase (glutamine-hydrolyzing) [Ignavibacteria bacterium]